MCFILTNLLVYFKISKNNCLLNSLKNEIYQYYVYNLDLPHREHATDISETPVGESPVEKKTNGSLL
jgi:hypothetical protein